MRESRMLGMEWDGMECVRRVSVYPTDSPPRTYSDARNVRYASIHPSIPASHQPYPLHIHHSPPREAALLELALNASVFWGVEALWAVFEPKTARGTGGTGTVALKGIIIHY